MRAPRRGPSGALRDRDVWPKRLPAEYSSPHPPNTIGPRLGETSSMSRARSPRVRNRHHVRRARRGLPRGYRQDGLRQDPRRHTGRTLLRPQERRGPHGQGDDLWCHRHRDHRPPTGTGKSADVVLGFDDLKGHLGGHPYFGRRRRPARQPDRRRKFSLWTARTSTLAVNNGPNSLHGGTKGFDKVVWKAEELPGPDPAVRFYLVRAWTARRGWPRQPRRRRDLHRSPKATELRIDYKATTDKHAGQPHQSRLFQPRRPRSPGRSSTTS